MALQVGDRVPAVALSTMAVEGPRLVTGEELFAAQRVVLFAVPGAFTPTCSDEHLPGFVARLEELRGEGVNRVACVAVNDIYVMPAGGKARGGGEGILMLADGNGDFTRAMGLQADLSRYGMGWRSRRYAAVVEDGEIRHLFVEPGAGVTVSGAEAVLAALRSAPWTPR